MPQLVEQGLVEVVEVIAAGFGDQVGWPDRRSQLTRCRGRPAIPSRSRYAVTPQETERLRALGFDNPLPPARRYWQPDANPIALAVGRKEEASRRRAALRAILDERDRLGEPWPGLRELCQRLRQVGHGASTRTVSKDLVVLGIANPMAGPAVEQRRATAAGPILPYEAA